MDEPMSDTEVDAVRRAWNRFGAPKTGGRLLATIDAKDAEIARLVGADRENYALTAEVQVLREENERLRSLVRKLYDARVRLLSDGASPERAAFQLADGELDTLNAALDGEKEPTDAEG